MGVDITEKWNFRKLVNIVQKFTLFFLLTALGNFDQQGYELKTAEVLR